jgi:hypothetical protein
MTTDRSEHYEPTLRDRVAVSLSNFVLLLATPGYRAFLKGSIEYGLRSAARDQHEGRTPPPNWRPT